MPLDPLERSLDGARWKLETYGPPDSPIKPVRDATATFENGRIHGTTGCNRYSAAYVLHGDRFTISRAISTRMFCDGVMEQEAVFLAALQAAQSLHLASDRLIIAYEGGVLQFVADTLSGGPPLPGRT